MNRAALDRIASAVLYEGYLLYPYRASAVKNRQRFNFGTLYPAGWARAASERTEMQTEVLVRGRAPRIDGAIRFLHLVEKPSPNGGRWQEAREREVTIPPSGTARISFPTAEEGQEPVGGVIEVESTQVGDDLRRITVRVRNDGDIDPGAPRDAALLRALVATHTLLGVSSGEFVSLLEPPEDAAAAAATCRNIGTWPVLVGEPGQRDTMLSSPIILYDYPAVAPESPGDLFDAAEIDEILSLRILTMTDEEKREARETDPRARALLERTEGLSQAEMIRLHGTLRDPHSRTELRTGAHVRIKPRPGGDVFDLALAGKAATVAAVERDDEGRLLLAVTVDDDPGKDLGVFGHRFFFRADEVEPLP